MKVKYETFFDEFFDRTLNREYLAFKKGHLSSDNLKNSKYLSISTERSVSKTFLRNVWK